MRSSNRKRHGEKTARRLDDTSWLAQTISDKIEIEFDREGMRCKLNGLAERYKDDDGMYLVSVLTTHDLNSTIIKDISELLYRMGT